MGPPPDVLLPFAPWLVAVIAMIALTLSFRFGRKGSPNRLGERYPAVEPAPGTRLRRERAVFGRGYFSTARVKIGADAQRLHVRVTSSFQGIGSFSMPLDEITAEPDRYPWILLSPDTIRLRFAREPETVLMIFPKALQAARGVEWRAPARRGNGEPDGARRGCVRQVLTACIAASTGRASRIATAPHRPSFPAPPTARSSSPRRHATGAPPGGSPRSPASASP
jgi:hypothetical protein